MIPGTFQLSFSAEIRVQITSADTVGVDVDVHAGFVAALVNLLEAIEESRALILLKAVGTEKIVNSLIAPGNPIEGRPEWIVDCDLCVL